jgi:manganese/zinc/iron transport system substrate-binding protein
MLGISNFANLGNIPYWPGRFLCVALLLAPLSTALGVPAGEKIKVVATTTMVADLARKVGAERVEVKPLMGPGVDPHLYKATAADIVSLQQADVILYNGLLLEGKMQDLFAKMARSKRFVYPVTESIPQEQLLEPPEFQGHYDPHVWFDIGLWQKTIETVVDALSEADPAGNKYYQQQAAKTRAAWDQLHQWALTKAAELPEEKRILVTSHDAYNYFGRAYGFRVVGLQGISTVTEAGLADMAKLVDFIRKNSVKAIFVESSVPHNAIERISKDAGVKIGGELFSDAMGTPGQMENDYDLGTYEGMIKHNLNTIVDALK